MIILLEADFGTYNNRMVYCKYSRYFTQQNNNIIYEFGVYPYFLSSNLNNTDKSTSLVINAE